MAEDQDDKVAARLARLKSPPRTKRNLRPYFVPAATLLIGTAMGAWAMMPRTDGKDEVESLPTSSVTEFQQDPGLAGFTVAKAPSEVSQPAAELTKPAPTIAPDPALEELRSRLASLERENKAAVEKLQAEVEAEKAKAAEQEQALSDAEAERRRLEEELLNAAQFGLPDQAAAEAEAQRLADLERRRQEAAEQRQRQINSPMVAFRAGGNAAASGADPAAAIEPGSAAADRAGTPDFLRAGAARAEITKAERIAHPGQTVVQGTMIEATLETSVDTSLPGNVVANVSQDVWSMDMSQVLIPRGAKLYGRYSNEISQGQRRVMIAWDRLIRADGLTVRLEGYGSDRVGRSGLNGKVRNHTLSRFGAATVVSVIGALPGILEAAANDGEEDDDSDALAEFYSGIDQGASNALSGTMAGYLNRPPTITLDQGQVVIVRVNNDLELF
ncbi:TrbI/VirB10 family protein [Paracoccus sp. MBLB3053]|uniref:TrbI/VirB10 family protein n=1 Tax=Paracoccus aurantius TaxID=3073814 RepID=A0ABU2HX90_9RHOB|nr:TrbI/VirB10 family protein [Paracoccus sp. MBLB3053]MDS9469666.1 TrbI/VirB10 family protein [Paracoccus sp. MBLB3053]